MSTPNSWLFSDNSRYSTGARLLFMGLSFTIGILTFLVYLAIWYACTRSRRSRLQRDGGAATYSADAAHVADRGMSDAAIAALPTFAYEGEAPAAGEDAEAEVGAAALDCAVCLGQVEAGEMVRRLPKCAHLFHADCVDAWLRAHSTCPMCRAPVGLATAASAKKSGSLAGVGVGVNTTAAASAAEELPPV